MFFVNYNTCIWQETCYIKCVCTFVNSNPCNCSMLHAGGKLIDARPNPADGLTMTNLTYYLHNNRTKHKTPAQEPDSISFNPPLTLKKLL